MTAARSWTGYLQGRDGVYVAFARSGPASAPSAFEYSLSAKTPNATAATSVRAQLDATPPSAAANDAAAGVDDGL